MTLFCFRTNLLWMSLYIMSGVYFGHYYNCILFHRKGHFKTNLKIYNWWNLICLAVEGNERLGLILFNLPFSLMPVFAGFSGAQSEAGLLITLSLCGSRVAEGFSLGASTDANDFWQFRWESLLIMQWVLCQGIMAAAPWFSTKAVPGSWTCGFCRFSLSALGMSLAPW